MGGFFSSAPAFSLVFGALLGCLRLPLPVTSIVIVGQTMANIAKYICLRRRSEYLCVRLHVTRDKVGFGFWSMMAKIDGYLLNDT